MAPVTTNQKRVDQLLEKIRQGDQRALGDFYREHRQPFIRFASKYVKDEELICDCYQDAILVLCEKVSDPDFRLENSAVGTYLFSIGKFILYNKLQKFARREAIHQKITFTTEQLAEFEYLNDPDPKVHIVLNALAVLGEKCREVLKLFYYQEKKLFEIKDLLGYHHTDVVKSQKSRCLKALKEIVHEKLKQNG
jgi:RNA polymerase sigma factor (sigma-70 family)